MSEIKFLAGKVLVHHWPKDTPKWSEQRISQIDLEINNNPNKKQIVISEKTIKINDFEFSAIKKVGISIPMFQKQSTLIFEGHCQEFDAHVHITTKEDDYLRVCEKLSSWRDEFFPESVNK